MGNLEAFASLMVDICDNWNVGYDQSNRNDVRPGGETDCSALTLFALRQTGFDVGNATYTGNMRAELTARGWVCLDPGVSLVKGDILLADAYHVAAYVGGGMIAQASIDERGEIAGGESGDQTGWETNTRSYYDYPWDCVLRWTGGDTVPVLWSRSEDVFNPNGYGEAYVLRVQKGLNRKGYGLVEDGILGAMTFAAVKDFQSKHGLLVDGIPGPDTMGVLTAQPVAVDVRGIQGAVRAVQDNVVGSDTRARVNALKSSSRYGGVEFPYGVEFAQRVVGTPVDGVWGAHSMKCHDETVAAVQSVLRGLGYDIVVDGVFGYETDCALFDALDRGVHA